MQRTQKDYFRLYLWEILVFLSNYEVLVEAFSFLRDPASLATAFSLRPEAGSWHKQSQSELFPRISEIEHEKRSLQYFSGRDAPKCETQATGSHFSSLWREADIRDGKSLTLLESLVLAILKCTLWASKYPIFPKLSCNQKGVLMHLLSQLRTI